MTTKLKTLKDLKIKGKVMDVTEEEISAWNGALAAAKAEAIKWVKFYKGNDWEILFKDFHNIIKENLK